MRKKTIKLLFGKKSTKTYWGRIGCSHGDRYGGYNNYRYGIKNLFSVGYYEGWGLFTDSKNAFN